MRRLLRSLVVSATALGVALATLGAAPACAEDMTVATAEVPATHDCEGGSAPAQPAHHHDCTMLAASCAPVLLAYATIAAPAPSLAMHLVPPALDQARPSDADRGPAPPPPRA